MLAEFWANYTGGGVHPADERFINASNSLRWNWPLSKRRIATWDKNTSLHGLMHVNLIPQPFIGNISTASVYILLANPGFAVSDYADDFANREHAEASEANLNQSGLGFYPLLKISDGTGAARYWRKKFKSIQNDLSQKMSVTSEKANEFLVREMAVIEAGPYHSQNFPGNWSDRLPTSRAARRFVRQFVLPRAAQGDALVVLLRRSSFWRISSESPGVIHRPPHQARLSHFLNTEKGAIVDFLASRYGKKSESLDRSLY